MGCGSSTDTAVHPLRAGGGEEDKTETKVGGRGDSAVSKATADSGVVMESAELPTLPGAVPMKLPPLTSETVRASEAGTGAQDGLREEDSPAQARLKSSVILEELLNEGIIPVGPAGVKASGAGEAYNIMLDGSEEVRRRPPARLESLKASKTQSPPSREEMDEKMSQVEERRKSREEDLKTRLKSARVRRSASATEEDEDTIVTLVEPFPLTPYPTSSSSPLSSSPAPPQARREAAEGGEWVREAGGDGMAQEVGGSTSPGDGAESAGKGGENGDQEEEEEEEDEETEEEEEEEEEEEQTQVEDLRAGELLSPSGLESDSSFQQADDTPEAF